MSTLRSYALWLMAISLCICAPALSAPVVVRPTAGKPSGDLFERLKAVVKDDQPFQLLVQIHLKPGTEEKLAAEAAKAAKATAAEPGCEHYAFFEDLESPGSIVLFEKWKNIAALKSHIEQPYTVSLLKLISDIEAQPTITILGPLGAQKLAP